MRLSASKVDCFFGCKRQFKYRFLKQPFPEPPVPWFITGNIAHYALEMLYKNGQHKLTDKKEQRRALTQYFKDGFKKYKAKENIKSGVLSKENILDVKQMLKDYLSILPTITGETKHTEQYFTINIDGIDVSGKADRVDKENEKYLVVDYKTSKKPKYDPASVQLPTYALWLEQEFKIPLEKTQGQYYYLRHLKKKNGIQNFDITQEIVDSAKEKYRQVASALEEPDFEYERNTKNPFCFICAYKSYCMRDNNNYLD